MNKKQVLKNLENDIYCKLKHSKIHGVGIFAIRDIPKGAHIFRGCKNPRWIGFREKELENIVPEVRKLVKDFFPFEQGKRWIPEFGLNNLSISFFANTSKRPNIRAVGDGKVPFIALRDIKKGEELTTDYCEFDEKERDKRRHRK